MWSSVAAICGVIGIVLAVLYLRERRIARHALMEAARRDARIELLEERYLSLARQHNLLDQAVRDLAVEPEPRPGDGGGVQRHLRLAARNGERVLLFGVGMAGGAWAWIRGQVRTHPTQAAAAVVAAAGLALALLLPSMLQPGDRDVAGPEWTPGTGLPSAAPRSPSPTVTPPGRTPQPTAPPTIRETLVRTPTSAAMPIGTPGSTPTPLPQPTDTGHPRAGRPVSPGHRCRAAG